MTVTGSPVRRSGSPPYTPYKGMPKKFEFFSWSRANINKASGRRVTEEFVTMLPAHNSGIVFFPALL